MGVIINRPAEVGLEDVLPHVEEARGRVDPIWEGGPVQRDSLFILHDSMTLGGEPVIDGVAFGGDVQLLSRILATADEELTFRLYSGYAGWDSGQLEMELSQGGWFSCPASPEPVFGPGGKDAWKQVLKGMGGNYALMAETPESPDLN